ncbi:MAG TPA: efflux RND transporter periplasmic adaptor subunit, partial [Anaerolineaceae bacterium]|nr:efflux RND transporter periplasmic adaptor subunit [Anaerolineaceae bacterium]
MKRIRQWFCIFIIAIGLTACSGTGAKATPTLVPTPITIEKPVYTVQRGTVTRTVQLTGRVTPIQQQDLFFRSDGFVKEVLVKAGDLVQAGAVLARLDEPEQYQADVAAAELACAQAQRALELATLDAPVKLAEAKQALEQAR